MDTLTIAFSAAWLAVGVYVAWIAIQNAQLARRLDELKPSVENAEREPYSRAA